MTSGMLNYATMKEQGKGKKGADKTIMIVAIVVVVVIIIVIAVVLYLKSRKKP